MKIVPEFNCRTPKGYSIYLGKLMLLYLSVGVLGAVSYATVMISLYYFSH